MSGRSGRGLLAERWNSPAVSRTALGVRLRQFRERCGLFAEEAGRGVGVSGSDITHLEQGQDGWGSSMVSALLTLYDVVDEADRARVLALTGQANAPGWWQPYQDFLPFWAQTYLGLEQAAVRIRSFTPRFIPGLLQTESYAREVIRLDYPHAPEGEVERRVELRMRRQQILHQARSPHLWAVIDEAALRRAVTGTDLMRAQIQHLIATSDDLPHVTVQILPFESGGRCGSSAPVTLMRLLDGGVPDIVYLEQPTSGVYLGRPADLDYYRHVMNRLATKAAPTAATSTLLRRILSDL
ncbi:MAG: helix-turn-helix domain-containing protein [Pseudonocardiaceae bacterium]